MGLFDKFFKKEELPTFEDDQVVAMCAGEFIPAEKIADPVFAKSMVGQTVAIEPSDGVITSPVNGVLEVVFPTGHAFGVRGNDGTGYLVHIGIDTVSMKGQGFKVLKKQGDTVKAGETVVKMDLAKVNEAGHPKTTMLIVTEPLDGKEYKYIDFGTVTRNQVISK